MSTRQNVSVYLFLVCIILASMKTEAGNLSFARDAFLLNSEYQKSAGINQSFTGKEDLEGYRVDVDGRRAIFGAGITARVTLFGEASLARVILIDNSGNEYLIYEVYSLIADEMSFFVNNACEETKVLNAVTPFQLRIELLGASVTLQKLTTLTNVPYPRNGIAAIQQTIREEQEKQKIDLLNESIKKKGMAWTAGHTSLSSLTYSQKKMMFQKDGMLANLQGFEYYIGGVFELNSNTPDLSVSTTQTMIDSFDWRNRHGANDPQSLYYDGDKLGGGWDTKIKDQSEPQYCGSCWAHSTLASAEMLANLYYNDHIDMDLAEQELMECSDACSYGKGCNGGSPSKASKWVVKYGIMEEDAFPYKASNSPVCGDSSDNPIENLRYEGTINISGSNASDDSLKQFLVHYGPLNVGIKSMSHAMSLVGYRKDSNDKTVWVFKNSHGTNSGKNGYSSVKPKNLSDFYLSAFKLPVMSKLYDDDDIRCVDLDKDGYYNWGVGPKPETCPECPDEGDCDDSRNDLGPMLPDGSCQDISTDMKLKIEPNAEIIFHSNPNPFNRFTTINFYAVSNLKTIIRIYTMSGEMIKKFTPSHGQDGVQKIVWDGTNQKGALIGSGVYLCKIEFDNMNTASSKSFKLFVSR